VAGKGSVFGRAVSSTGQRTCFADEIEELRTTMEKKLEAQDDEKLPSWNENRCHPRGGRLSSSAQELNRICIQLGRD
jgi:hypothetical protein